MIDVPSLQGIADASVEKSTVSVKVENRPIENFDDFGRNLASVWVVCPTCASSRTVTTSPDNQPEIKLQAECPTCHGIGATVDSESYESVEILTMTVGQTTFEALLGASINSGKDTRQDLAGELVNKWASAAAAASVIALPAEKI